MLLATSVRSYLGLIGGGKLAVGEAPPSSSSPSAPSASGSPATAQNQPQQLTKTQKWRQAKTATRDSSRVCGRLPCANVHAAALDVRTSGVEAAENCEEAFRLPLSHAGLADVAPLPKSPVLLPPPSPPGLDEAAVAVPPVPPVLPCPSG